MPGATGRGEAFGSIRPKDAFAAEFGCPWDKLGAVFAGPVPAGEAAVKGWVPREPAEFGSRWVLSGNFIA